MATNKNRTINLSSISDAALHGIENYTKARAAWIACAKIENESERKTEAAAYRKLMTIAAFDVLATGTEKSERVDRENRAAEKGKTLPAPVSKTLADAYASMITGDNPDYVFKAYKALFERLGVEGSEKGLTRAVKTMAVLGKGTTFSKDKNGLKAAGPQGANRAAMDALVDLMEKAGFEHDRATGRLSRPEAVKAADKVTK